MTARTPLKSCHPEPFAEFTLSPSLRSRVNSAKGRSREVLSPNVWAQTPLVDLSVLACPVLLAQVTLENLTCAALGQSFCTKLNTAGDFVTSDLRACMYDQLIRTRAHPRLTDYYCMHYLSPLLVWDANHCRFQDRRMGVQGIFHLGGVDVFAARDDHVLRSIDDVDEVFLI